MTDLKLRSRSYWIFWLLLLLSAVITREAFAQTASKETSISDPVLITPEIIVVVSDVTNWYLSEQMNQRDPVTADKVLAIWHEKEPVTDSLVVHQISLGYAKPNGNLKLVLFSPYATTSLDPIYGQAVQVRVACEEGYQAILDPHTSRPMSWRVYQFDPTVLAVCKEVVAFYVLVGRPPGSIGAPVLLAGSSIGEVAEMHIDAD